MPISTSGAIAAVDNAAIVHQLIPCDPVWLATITGKVWASKPVSNEEKKYSFQHRTIDKMKAATMPGRAIGRMILKKAPQIEQPSTRAACSISVGIVSN